jgi:hypothetical protein
VVRARDRTWDVLRAARQLTPHRVLAGQPFQRSPGQERLEGHLTSVLLADQDDQRGPAVAGIGDRIDRIAEAGGGVQVDERRLAVGQRVAAGHPDHRPLVQSEHEPQVGGEIGQERDLGGARVAEDRGQAVPAHHLEGGVPDGVAGRRESPAVALPRVGLHASRLAHRG